MTVVDFVEALERRREERGRRLIAIARAAREREPLRSIYERAEADAEWIGMSNAYRSYALGGGLMDFQLRDAVA